MALCWALYDSFQWCLESRCNNTVWPPDGEFETVILVWEDNFASVCRCLCSPSWTQLGDRVSPIIFSRFFPLADPGSTERKLQLKRKVLISPFCLLSQHGRCGSATKRQTDPNNSGKISLFFFQSSCRISPQNELLECGSVFFFFFPCSVYSRKPILVFSCRQTPPEENSTNSKNTTWLLTTPLYNTIGTCSCLNWKQERIRMWWKYVFWTTAHWSEARILQKEGKVPEPSGCSFGCQTHTFHQNKRWQRRRASGNLHRAKKEQWGWGGFIAPEHEAEELGQRPAAHGHILWLHQWRWAWCVLSHDARKVHRTQKASVVSSHSCKLWGLSIWRLKPKHLCSQFGTSTLYAI